MSEGDRHWLSHLFGSMFWGLSRLLIPVIVLAAPLWLSYLFWLFKAPLAVSIALVDYTVPFDNYAEHQGIHWLLSHEKIPPPSPSLALTVSLTLP